ncbi:MAG: DNA polymerase III subunit delta [Muribaculaceae bacterium]|nr:DNA polymerase III subunit delta [Muribaculaceae bacterium]
MATAAAPTFDGIRKSLKAGDIAPVYILHGEEGYFTDELLKDFEELLPEADREFNQYVVYAPETDPERIINLCRGVPMMAERQVVIVKEAQEASNKLKKLAPYIAAPVPTTVLVIALRGAALKDKDVQKAAKSGGAVVLESKKIAEWNVAAFIGRYIREKGLNADQKVQEMLRDFVGTDLSRIYNEIDKLATLLPPNATITPEVVERNIGISREYNTFELVDALAYRDGAKAFRILKYMRANPKAIPVVMATTAIFGFFADLLTAYFLPDRTEKGLVETFGFKTLALRRMTTAMQRYTHVQAVEIISAIRRFDAQNKGVDSRRQDIDLFQELVYHILTATGRL